MSEKSDLNVVNPQIKEGDFQKDSLKPININNFKNLPSAGKSNSQSEDEEILRQCSSEITNSDLILINEKCNSVAVSNNNIPPSPKLRRRLSAVYEVNFTSSSNKSNNSSAVIGVVDDQKESNQIKISETGTGSTNNHKKVNAHKISKAKSIPPPPPLHPAPMPPATTKSSSGVTFPVAEPKVIKKGDTVIKSYVDEKTGKISVYEPGIKLEVSHIESGKWYPAKVREVDLKDAEILIHYEKWSSRFDEWIKMDSPRLRPSANTNVVKVEFKVGEKVEAIWNTDGQRYPGVIIQVFPQQDYYEVQFDDGIKCKKKSNQIFKIKRCRSRPSVEAGSASIETSSSSQKSIDSPSSVVPSNANMSPVPWDNSSVSAKEEKVNIGLESSLPLQTTISQSRTPPVHFSIFTPPSGELGKRKRTIQDYSALLKRPTSKSFSVDNDETVPLGDSAALPPARKKKQLSSEINIVKPIVENHNLASCQINTPTQVLNSDTSILNKSQSVKVEPTPTTDTGSLPAKRIRKPSRRWSTFSDDEYSCSPETKKVKTKFPKKLANSHVGIIDEIKTEPTLPTLKETHGMDESMNGVCKAKSPVTSVIRSPASIMDTNSEDSSDTSDEKLVNAISNSEGSNLVSALKARRRGRIQFRTKVPSDLANLEIPPPPASGYRLKKLYLEIDKVNDVNIEQVVSDPEGIIFKLNDPVPEGWRKEAQLKFRNETYPKWFISYVSPAGDRFRYLKQMHKLIQEANFDFTPFDFRPLNPRLQEIAKMVSGGHYSYKRRTNMPPPPLLSELETSPGVGVAVVPKLSRRQSAQIVHQQSPVSTLVPPDSKIESGFVDAEGNDVTIEQGEDGGWACPAQGCDKHFRKDSLLQMHFKHYHPEMKVKSRGGVKIANVVEMAQARTAFDYDEPSLNAPKVLPSLSEPDISIPSPSVTPTPVVVENCTSQSLCKRSRATELRDKEVKEEPAEKTDMPSNALNECKVEIPENEDASTVPSDNGVDNGGRIPEDTFTDAVEISATDYKRPRINLRRKFLSKRHNLYRLPIRTSLKLDSFSTKKERINKELASVNQRTNSESSKVHTMSNSTLQIIVEKCDSVNENSSKVSPVSSELPAKEVAESENVISTSLGTSLRARINGIRNNSVLKSIRRREKRKATSLQVKRVRNFVKNRRGSGRPRFRKPVGYFSGLTRKQVCRIRREIVDKSIPIRFLGDPKLKDVKVDIINCICNGHDEFGMMVQCELCHCWQHGNCFGFYEDEDLPKYYVCESCRNRGNPSETRSWEWQVQGYYKTGQLPTFSNPPTTNFGNARVRAQCIEVKNWIQSTMDCIENCNFKLKIAQKKPDHPKLYNWEYPSENPLREKQIRDFQKTYKPWFYRRFKALQANDVDHKRSMRKSYLKHLYWKKFQVLVDDFKWGIRNLDAKFLIILNKLSIYQRWRVRNKMEEKRRLNLVDKETPYTNPFAIWARKRRQRQQWESKMRRHASILEKEMCIQELIFKSETARSSLNSKVDRPVSNNTNEFSKSSVFNPLDRLKSVGSSNVRDNVFPTGEMKFSFCTKCRASAFKTWDWSEFSGNGDEFFENNTPDSASKNNSPKTYKPSTLKSLCETVIASLKSNKESSLSASDRDAKRENLFDYCNINITDNIEAGKETRPLVEDFNCSDTTESIDCEDCPADKEIPVNLDEECIRCYLISISLSKDTNYTTFSSGISGLRNRYQSNQSESEKFSAVNLRDILTFLDLADAFRQGIWDSVENTLPNIPVTLRRSPIINRNERISAQRIILHYNAELRRYWKRMFNIRLRGFDLIMQQQTWVDELVRLYSEIHLLLEDMLKVVDESTQMDKLGEVLLRKIDIFRSICGTPDSSPSDSLITSADLFYEIENSKSFISGVLQATDKPSTSKESSETMVRQNSKSPEKTEKRSNLNESKDTDDSVVDVVESCILKIELGEIPNIDLHKKTDQHLETEKASSSKSDFKNLQNHKHSNKTDEEVETITRVKSEEKDELSSPNQNLITNGPICLNTSTTPNTDINLFPVKNEPSCSTIETDAVLPSVLSDDLVIDSLPDFDIPDVDISMDIFNDPAFMEPSQKPRTKQTIVPKVRGPFLKKLTAESCRDNLLDNILQQQELIDSHLDKLEEKVCELERKYAKRKQDPKTSKKWVQVVQTMLFFNNKLQFLKTNAELLCGGQKASSTAVSDGDNDVKVEQPSVGNSNISDDYSDVNPDRF